MGGSILTQIPLPRLPRNGCAPEAQRIPEGLWGAGPARDPQCPIPQALSPVDKPPFPALPSQKRKAIDREAVQITGISGISIVSG